MAYRVFCGNPADEEDGYYGTFDIVEVLDGGVLRVLDKSGESLLSPGYWTVVEEGRG